MISRRHILQGLAAAPFALAMSGRRFAAAPASRPRMFVQLFLSGGIDAILCADPKTRDELDPTCDAPFRANEIVERGGRRFGPILAPLGGELDRLAVINNVHCGTVGHAAGALMLHDMRGMAYRRETRGFTGRLGMALRDKSPGTFPLESLRLIDPNALVGRTASNFRGGDQALFVGYEPGQDSLLARMWKVSQGPREVERVLAEQPGHDATDTAARHSLADLMKALRGTELPPPPQIAFARLDPKLGYPLAMLQAMWGPLLRDLLFALEHRLAPAVFATVPAAQFDTHQLNLSLQHRQFAPVLVGIEYFLQQLRERTTSDGVTLADQVGLAISSELGRFPLLNRYNGKDHFPEMPMFLAGPGLAPIHYGKTDRKMMALPSDPTTGLPSTDKAAFVPELDDVATTIFKWFGAGDAETYGYIGRPLDRLLA